MKFLYVQVVIMFWQSLGVGSLINLASSKNQRRDISLIQQQSLVSLRDELNKLLSSGQNEIDADFEEDGSWEAKTQLAEALNSFVAPEYSHEAVMQMQSDYYENRRRMSQDLSFRLADLKANFYDEHCFKSHELPNGTVELVFDSNGQPELIDGYETPELKILRTKWENQQRLLLIEKQDEERDKFVSVWKEKLLDFLRENKRRLVVDRIYTELADMVKEMRSQAVEIVLRQDRERWFLELPETYEIKAIAEEGLNELEEFCRQEAAAEAASDDVQEIINFEREMASYIYQCRHELRRKRYDDNDFLDLRGGLQARRDEYIDFTEALPAHMVSCLEDLGITNDLL
ncbi:MAG: hypothetical protein ACI376_08050 [Candidatus Bruticola sp.]